MEKINQKTKKLNEVCEILIGGTPSRSISKYWKNGTLPWVSIADMSREGKFINETKEKITEIGAKESNVKLIPKGTLLFSFKLSIGKLAFAEQDLYTNEAIAGFVIKDQKELDKEFLYYFLQSSTFDTAQRAVKGNTLNKEKMKVLEIPLPPLSEQKKIVAILDEKFAKLREAKQLREEAIANTEKILSATLREIFKEGKQNGWEEKNIGDISKLMTGATPSTSRREYYGGDIKWLVSGDIHNKEIFDCEGRINELGVKNSNAKVIPKNSLLIALNGQGKTKGTVSILRTEATCNQSLVAIIPNENVMVEYLYYCLHSQYRKIRGMAGDDSRKGLNMKLVREITFILPTLKEQQKIVKRLDELNEKVRKAIELQKSQLEDLKKLEKAYLREAFNGELI